jgi:hypothetical protein
VGKEMEEKLSMKTDGFFRADELVGGGAKS